MKDQRPRLATLLPLWVRAVRHLTGYSGPLYNEKQAEETSNARAGADEKVAPAAAGRRVRQV